MKRIFALLAASATLLVSCLTACADDRPIAPEKLPAAAKTFIQNTFPGQTITYATKDVDFMKTTYDVYLSSGVKVKFTGKGEWDKVDAQYQPVPAAIVPKPIADYVAASFPGAFIVKIDKEPYGFEIELNNDMELKFNPAGQLMYIDD